MSPWPVPPYLSPGRSAAEVALLQKLGNEAAQEA